VVPPCFFVLRGLIVFIDSGTRHVLYAPAERAAVEQAAGLAGLRPSSSVAWAAVTMCLGAG
jgi:hypothetical protein